MELYLIMTLLLGIILLVIENKIHQGKTDLINDYRQINVKEEDKKAYGRAFSKGLYGIAISFITSGLVSLLHKSTIIYVGILVLGIIASLVIIIRTQKKYNGSIFS